MPANKKSGYYVLYGTLMVKILRIIISRVTIILIFQSTRRRRSTDQEPFSSVSFDQGRKNKQTNFNQDAFARDRGRCLRSSERGGEKKMTKVEHGQESWRAKGTTEGNGEKCECDMAFNVTLIKLLIFIRRRCRWSEVDQKWE